VRNEVVVGPRASLEVSGVEATDVTWYADASTREAGEEITCTAQVRAHGVPIPARARWNDGILRVQFDRPESGVAPGQAVVCYDDQERILGGGWIRATLEQGDRGIVPA
jgi:tRNA-specific 2-thiouridylase